MIANVGYGHGFSVKEILDHVRQITGVEFPITTAPRRPGDPPTLIADGRRIREILGWQPRHDDLAEIVGTSWAWERRLAALLEARPGGSR